MRRLGRFFVILLATVGALTLLVSGLGLYIVGKVEGKKEPLPSKMVVHLDLDRGLSEGTPNDPFARLQQGDRLTVRELVEGLAAAARDQKVTALVASLNGAKIGMAEAQELRDAVAAFRASGKRAIVYSESLGEFGPGTIAVYVASAFDEVVVQPSGDVGFTGFLVESPFLRGTLDLLGAQPQFGGRHEFKSAIEMITEKGFTVPAKQNMQGLIDSWTTQVIDGVAQARKLDPAVVRGLMDNGPLLAAEAKDAKLIDHLAYWDEVEADLTTDGAKLVDFSDYAEHSGKLWAGGTKIALIHGVGQVMRGESEYNPVSDNAVMGSQTVAEAFDEAAKDPDVKAILFRIDSPGGSYVASDTIWRAVNEAKRKGKPVIVSMGHLAASGGYFSAMPADAIVAQPGTVTGSIGVFAGKVALADFWSKIGVSWDGIGSGANAGMWSMNKPFDPRGWDRLNAMLDHVYDDFTTKAAQGRKLPMEQMDKVARGRVWTGIEAKKVGLVDELGGLPKALEIARAKAGLAPNAAIKLVEFPAEKSPLEALLSLAGSGKLPAKAQAAFTDPRLTRALEVAEPLLKAMESTQGPTLAGPNVPRQ